MGVEANGSSGSEQRRRIKNSLHAHYACNSMVTHLLDVRQAYKLPAGSGC